MEDRNDLNTSMSDDRPEFGPELVEVFRTEQESEAMVVRGLLESDGIEALITGLDAPQDVLPGVGGVRVLVTPENADAARRLIAERSHGPEPGEELDAADLDDLDESGANEDSAA